MQDPPEDVPPVEHHMLLIAAQLAPHDHLGRQLGRPESLRRLHTHHPAEIQLAHERVEVL